MRSRRIGGPRRLFMPLSPKSWLATQYPGVLLEPVRHRSRNAPTTRPGPAGRHPGVPVHPAVFRRTASAGPAASHIRAGILSRAVRRERGYPGIRQPLRSGPPGDAAEARDTGQAAATGPISLVQGTSQGVGFSSTSRSTKSGSPSPRWCSVSRMCGASSSRS